MADSDNDQRVVLLDYTLRSSPTAKDHEPEFTIKGDEVHLTRRNTLAGASLIIESSADLKSWQDATTLLSTTREYRLAADRQQITYSWPSTMPVSYLRLQATLN